MKMLKKEGLSNTGQTALRNFVLQLHIISFNSHQKVPGKTRS
jgi:hypothetical protein